MTRQSDDSDGRELRYNIERFLVVFLKLVGLVAVAFLFTESGSGDGWPQIDWREMPRKFFFTNTGMQTPMHADAMDTICKQGTKWVRSYVLFLISLSLISFPKSSLITMGSIAPEDLQQTGKPTFPDQANTLEYARSLDSKDHMRSFRQKFKIPSKSNIKSTKVVKQGLPHYPSFHVTMLTFPLQNNPMTHAYISVVTLWVFSLEQ